MEPGMPSRTAIAAAKHRAAHQVLEQGRLFFDPLALRILDESPESISRWAEERPSARGMRLFIAARSRFAEDALQAAIERGVSQIVVLGAGLDTLAYRRSFGDGVRIFEVDHPETQTWKRRRLAQAGIPSPGALTYAPVDFERQGLAEGLAAAGFDRGRQTFFTWLGVVPYLTDDAIWATLRFVAAIPNGAHVVFDYGNPPGSLAVDIRMRHDARAARVAALGEAFVTYFDEDELHPKLTALGFAEIEDLGPRQIVARYFSDQVKRRDDKGGHIIRASTRTTCSTD